MSTTTTTIPVFGATGSTATPPAQSPTTTTTAPMTVNLPQPGNTTTTTPVTPSSNTATQSTFPGTNTTQPFPGAANDPALSAEFYRIYDMLQNTGAAQFFADNKISSADQPMYLTSSGGLNANAVYLTFYRSASQQERQAIQSSMVTAGLMPATNANGTDNTVALGAFTSLIGQTSMASSNPFDYLNQNATPENAIQNEISAGLTTAQKNASAPEIITQTNPTTLAADLTNAFDQALGYAPSQDQIQSFIDQVQKQETTYGNAPRAEAQAQVNQAHAEESALNKIGPNGIDTVINAYQQAVNGIPGGGTAQGPVNGAVQNPSSPLPAGTPTPGSALPAGVTERYTPQGNLVGGDIMPTTTTSPTTSPEGGLFGFVDNNILHKGVVTPSTSSTSSFVHQNAPYAPAGAPNTTPTHGGMFALSPKDWQEAAKLYPLAKKYATPGQAPEAVQHAAMTALLQNAYDSNGGSWSKAISTVASGSPFGKAQGTHLSAFGDNIAAQINSQLQAVQNQVTNSTVTEKVSAPDANAEAASAAKQADPVGYYAANAASWGQMLNQMLTGAPLMYNQTTADTFQGPVPVAVAGTASSSGVAPSTANTGVK